MQRFKKYLGLFLALMMCLTLSACGSDEDSYDDVVVDDETIDMHDLAGYWSPYEGLGNTNSVLTSIYLNGTDETWEEYDIYGMQTGSSGEAYTDGIVLTLKDVPLIGDVEIPIRDEDTLVDENGEVYWVKGDPGFKEEPQLSSSFYGNWYLKGDTSEWATILTLNEDGTYTLNGTNGIINNMFKLNSFRFVAGRKYKLSYSEYEQTVTVGETNEVVFRQEIALTEYSNEMYYLVNDGQVLVHWADDGDNYYIHESALDNESLRTEYSLTDGSFWGQDYILEFLRSNTVNLKYFNEVEAAKTGTWVVEGNRVIITWEDGETDEAAVDGKIIILASTNETMENPW